MKPIPKPRKGRTTPAPQSTGQVLSDNSKPGPDGAASLAEVPPPEATTPPAENQLATSRGEPSVEDTDLPAVHASEKKLLTLDQAKVALDKSGSVGALLDSIFEEFYAPPADKGDEEQPRARSDSAATAPPTSQLPSSLPSRSHPGRTSKAEEELPTEQSDGGEVQAARDGAAFSGACHEVASSLAEEKKDEGEEAATELMSQLRSFQADCELAAMTMLNQHVRAEKDDEEERTVLAALHLEPGRDVPIGSSKLNLEPRELGAAGGDLLSARNIIQETLKIEVSSVRMRAPGTQLSGDRSDRFSAAGAVRRIGLR